MCVLFLPVRLIVFAIVWMMTWGNLTFWLLPNLTEDVGFFESFRPLYQCMYESKSDSSSEDTAVASSDDGKSAETAEVAEEEEKSGDHVEELEGAGDYDEDGDDDENKAAEDGNGVETSSNDDDDDDDDAGENEELSPGANDNGYEMVSADDILTGEAAENVEDGDRAETGPAVRRRKGKRRIT